jgi:hypothetical protein
MDFFDLLRNGDGGGFVRSFRNALFRTCSLSRGAMLHCKCEYIVQTSTERHEVQVAENPTKTGSKEKINQLRKRVRALKSEVIQEGKPISKELVALQKLSGTLGLTHDHAVLQKKLLAQMKRFHKMHSRLETQAARLEELADEVWIRSAKKLKSGKS